MRAVSASAIFAVRTTSAIPCLSLRACPCPKSASACGGSARTRLGRQAHITPPWVSSRDALLVPDTSPKFAVSQLRTERDRSGREQMLACALSPPALAPRIAIASLPAALRRRMRHFSFHPASDQARALSRSTSAQSPLRRSTAWPLRCQRRSKRPRASRTRQSLGQPRLSHRMARGSSNLADESKPVVGVADI